MGLRFRKSVKLGKGVKLNFGKKSAGVSFGGRHGGVSINSRSGARGRVSLPGTGISYSTKLTGGKKKPAASSRPARAKTSSRVSVQAPAAHDAKSVKSANPPKPPKSPKVYLVCGIIMVPLGLLMLFLFWPLGVFFTALGVYYIACGPKIYSGLVEKYKAVHPEYEEETP